MEHTNHQRIAQFMLSVFAAAFMTFALMPHAAAGEKKKDNKEYDKVIKLGVKPGQMRYDKKKLTVPAGGEIKLIFDNTNGTLQHNVLILVQGDKQSAISLAQKAWSMQNPIQNDYVPDSEKVLYATSLLSPGEKETITFTAPEKPGNYPYVCTMPGHSMSMNGMIKVKKSKKSKSGKDKKEKQNKQNDSEAQKKNSSSNDKKDKNKKEKFDKVVKLGVKPGMMRYDIEEFTVPAGGRIKFIFDNTNGTLQHNVLILQKGDKDFAIKLAQKAWGMQNPLQNDYVPDSKKVLHHTALLSPGEKETITFKAPEKPGDHPYVCTMPGHSMTMNGMMHVKGSSKKKKSKKQKAEKTDKKNKKKQKTDKGGKTSKTAAGSN